MNSDTVLVQPGTYVENINYNGKNITVASLFLTTQDTTYISQTVIDGNQNGSVVKFENSEDSTAVLTGLTITNGNASGSSHPDNYGGGIFCRNNSNPSLKNMTIMDNYASLSGGGVCISYSSPDLMNITISGNSSYFLAGGIYCNNSSPNLQDVTISENSAGNGGGISFATSSSNSLVNVTVSSNTARISGGSIFYSHSNISLENVTITDNYAGSSGGGIYCSYNSTQSFNPINRCNIFMNYAGSGCEVYAYYCPTIDIIVDKFTVLYSGEYFTFPIDNYTFDILNAKIEQVDQDLYVSPNGSDSNSGLTVDDPLLTISYAYVKILADITNPLTIHLANGIYSPFETGERFPLNCRSYISLLGEDKNSTILSGESMCDILSCNNDNNFSIENITIQEGEKGISFLNSSPSLLNVAISGNIG